MHKNMGSLEDPRHYLAIKPVPAWEMAKDAKLKARSFDQYNLGSPTRYDMFKYNYMRRLRQMNSQGFMSSQSKPYQPVGNLVLNVKELVKKTLGQDKSDKEPLSPRKKTLKEEPVLSSRSDRRRPATSPIYSSRMSARSRKPLQHLQDIASNLNAVENTKYSVKMGHSLFEVLDEKAQNDTQTVAIMQVQDLQNTDPSSKEGPVMKKQGIEEDDSVPGPKSLPVPQWFMNIENGNAKIPHNGDNVHSQSYTSMEATQNKDDTDFKTYFLWRQLCVLHWLIEACRIQQKLTQLSPGECLVPLAECWNVVKPGGSTMSRVFSNFGGLERNASTSSLQVPSRSLSRSTSYSGTFSIQGAWSSPTTPRKIRDFSLTVDTPTTPVTPVAGPLQPEVNDLSEEGYSEVFEYEDTTNYHKNLVKLLDTVKESVRKEMLYRERIANDEAEMKGKLRRPVYHWAMTPYPKSLMTGNSKQSNNQNGKIQSSLVIKKATIRPHTAGPMMKHTGYRDQARTGGSEQGSFSPRRSSTPTKRPQSSPPKLSLNQAMFSSDQREKTMVKLREQFQEVTDLKALRLHQSLTELRRSRWNRIEKKFEAFQIRQLSIHRDLKDMRSAASREANNERANTRSTSPSVSAMQCEWYIKLLQLTSAQDATDKPCLTVLKSLEESAARFMGWQQRENMNQIRRHKATNIMDNQLTSESFVTVLRRLRSFEIFAPDVSAAIEFMKKFIVKMPDEQFDDVVRKLV